MSGGAKAPLDRLRSEKKPFTRTARIATDTDLADAFDQVQTERDDLIAQAERFTTFLDKPVPDDVRRKLEDVEARFADLSDQVDESVEVFKFRGLARGAYDDLLAEHPPTPKMIEKSPDAEFNPDTFMPALCEATCITHDLGIDGWKVIFDPASEQWNAAETTMLFNTAQLASVAYRTVETGKGSAAKRS